MCEVCFVRITHPFPYLLCFFQSTTLFIVGKNPYLFKRVVGDVRPDVPAESCDNIVGSYQPFVSASGEMIFQALILCSAVDPVTLVADAQLILPRGNRATRSDPLSGDNICFFFTATGRVDNETTRNIHIKAAEAFQKRYPKLDSLVIADNLNTHKQPALLAELLDTYGQGYLFTPPNLTHIYGICDDLIFACLSKTFAEKRAKIAFDRSLVGKKGDERYCFVTRTVDSRLYVHFRHSNARCFTQSHL